METEFQNDPGVVEAELSPAEMFRQRWRQQPGAIPFLRQKSMVEQHAELLPYVNAVSARGWTSPMVFACQGLVIAAVVLSFVNWYATRNIGPLQDEIVALQTNVQEEARRQQGVMDANQAEAKRIEASSRTIVWTSVTREEALRQLASAREDSRNSFEQYKQRMAQRENELRSRQRAEVLAASGTPLVFSLALVLAAGLVASGVRRDLPRNNVGAAGDYYLYFATASGLWQNLVFVVLLHLALSGSAYGLSKVTDAAGPIIWIVFWSGLYAMLLRYFVGVARDMYKVMQIRPPASEWSPANRVLLRINNSFLMMFAGLEAVFLGCMYVFYLVSRRFA